MIKELTNDELRYIEKILDNQRSVLYDRVLRYNELKDSSKKDIIYKLELDDGLSLLKAVNEKIKMEWEVREDE